MEAEECLAPPPFDLNRYGDNLINVIMVCCFNFLTAMNMWWIFLVLSVSLLFIYGWDCYRFKRATARTHFATQDIDLLANYIMAIPCAILAGAFFFKLSGGQRLVQEWERDAFFSENPEIWLRVGVAFASHLALHWAILAFLVPWFLTWRRPIPCTAQGSRDEIPYEHTAAKICCNCSEALCLPLLSKFSSGTPPLHAQHRATSCRLR